MTISFTSQEFVRIKEKTERMYKDIGSIRCPYLKQDVAFNAKGLDHIKLSHWNHARTEHDQFVRLKLLHLAPSVVHKSHTLQGIRKRNSLERIKVHSRWEYRSVRVTYYEFISIETLQAAGSLCRVKIILKQIESESAYFWSIIPYWKQKGDDPREMFEGNLEED